MAQMAESTDSPTPQPPEDNMNWGFAYLREDIQDIRQEFRGQLQEVRAEIKTSRQELRGEILELRKDIATRFNYTIGAMVTLAVGIAALIKV